MFDSFEYKPVIVNEDIVHELEARIINVDKILCGTDDENTIQACSETITKLHGYLNKAKKGL